MKIKEYKKLIKKENPKQIIRDYINDFLSLTDRQLKEVIELKNKEEVENIKK